MYNLLLICSLADGYVSCFHFGVFFLINVAMNIHVQVLSFELQRFSFLLDYIHRS